MFKHIYSEAVGPVGPSGSALYSGKAKQLMPTPIPGDGALFATLQDVAISG